MILGRAVFSDLVSGARCLVSCCSAAASLSANAEGWGLGSSDKTSVEPEDFGRGLESAVDQREDSFGETQRDQLCGCWVCDKSEFKGQLNSCESVYRVKIEAKHVEIHTNS